MRYVNADKLIIDALRYMRVPPDGHTPELVRVVEEAFVRLEECITPRIVWKRFHVEHFDVGIELEGGNIYSKDIARLTARGEECYVLAATLGLEADRQIALAQRKDMLEGIALDACASVRIDDFVDGVVSEEIVASLREGEGLTHRFSPGYGDLSMSVTEEIIGLLDATRRIGLGVTRSLMMTPVKSITAIIGLRQKCPPH